MKNPPSIKEDNDFRILLSSVTNYEIGINKNYQIIIANNLFRNEFDVVIGSYCYQAWKKQDKPCENCLVKKTFQNDQVHHNEETVIMKDGQMAQMLMISTPVHDINGDIIYVLETATDITEKHNIANQIHLNGNINRTLLKRLTELQQSEEKYRTIFEHSRDAIIITGPDARIIDVNQASLEILGYKQKKDIFSIRSAFDFFKDKAYLKEFMDKVLSNGFIAEFETKIVGNYGRVIDVLVSSNVIANLSDTTTSYVFIFRDITKRKKTEEELSKHNLRLVTLNAISITVSSTLNINEVLNSAIIKICEILEFECIRIYLLNSKKDELNLEAHHGHSSKFIGRDKIKNRQVGDGILGQTILTEKPFILDDIMESNNPYIDFIMKEGLRSSVYIPLISKGKPVGVMCVSTYSKFKFSEDYIDFLMAAGNQIGVAIENANLYKNIKATYQKMKRAQEQVIRSEKLASLGKLAATIAHEINNPLAAVLTYIKLMLKMIRRKKFLTERLPDITRYLEIMETETARSGEIVKNLLSFSRHSKTIIGIHHISEILDKTLFLIQHDLLINNIRIVKQITPDLPPIKCDSKQIQQVLLNLVGNASSSMADGGILTVAANISQDKKILEVAISDTGCGITDKNLKNIFEPFFTTKEEGKGVGLGLSVAYGIIASHNGIVEVKTKLNEGSTFKICLPFPE